MAGNAGWAGGGVAVGCLTVGALVGFAVGAAEATASSAHPAGMAKRVGTPVGTPVSTPNRARVGEPECPTIGEIDPGFSKEVPRSDVGDGAAIDPDFEIGPPPLPGGIVGEAVDPDFWVPFPSCRSATTPRAAG